jgi:hypothetical protein
VNRLPAGLADAQPLHVGGGYDSACGMWVKPTGPDARRHAWEPGSIRCRFMPHLGATCRNLVSQSGAHLGSGVRGPMNGKLRGQTTDG